jgi:hypothetical protein
MMANQPFEVKDSDGKGTLGHPKDDLVLHHLHSRKHQGQTVDLDFVPVAPF